MSKALTISTPRAVAINDAQAKAEMIFDLLDINPTTRDDYKARISLFIEFIKRAGFNSNSFLEYKRTLGERTDYSVATKNKYLTTARVFLKELNRLGQIPQDITQNTKTFTQSKKHKRDGLNDEEINALTEQMRTLPDSPQATRIKAILALLTLQGLRQIEITRLDVKDIDFVSQTAFIQGKGQDDKELIHLHPETAKALQGYLKSNKLADGALFTCQSNRHLHWRLTTRAVRGIIKAVLGRLGINRTIHGFRHYFTTKLIQTYKGDLLEVARYTRHKSLEMLQVYNDNIRTKADLPRYYGAFEGVKF